MGPCSQRDQRPRQARPCAIEKQTHAQCFTSLNGHHAHLPLDGNPRTPESWNRARLPMCPIHPQSHRGWVGSHEPKSFGTGQAFQCAPSIHSLIVDGWDPTNPRVLEQGKPSNVPHPSTVSSWMGGIPQTQE